jgi:hypothetical protein
VIGNGDSRQTSYCRFGDQVARAGRAVEEAVGRVAVQLCPREFLPREISARSPPPLPVVFLPTPFPLLTRALLTRALLTRALLSRQREAGYRASCLRSLR